MVVFHSYVSLPEGIPMVSHHPTKNPAPKAVISRPSTGKNRLLILIVVFVFIILIFLIVAILRPRKPELMIC